MLSESLQKCILSLVLAERLQKYVLNLVLTEETTKMRLESSAG